MKILFGNNDVTKRIITKTEKAFAFPSKKPILPGHILVCPRRPVETIDELEGDEIQALFSLVKEIKNALEKEFGATGFNTAWNEGCVAGQTVPHLHIHVVPRSPNDKGITPIEPRQFLYRLPGERQDSPQNELIEVAQALSRHF